MKKVLVIVMVAALATAASAAIFTEDFEGTVKQANTWTYGATIGDHGGAGSYGTWYMGANGIMSGAVAGMTGEFAQVQGIDSGKSRSVAIAIDGSGIAAGDYTLTWNFNMYGNATQSVQVWDVDASAGGFYTLKYADNTPVAQVVTDGALATATQLGLFSQFHPAGAGALTGAGSLDFTYDGTGDIGLQFTISSDVTWGWKPLLNIDDISIAAVPEPATMVLLGLGSLVLRRRK